MPSNAIIKTKAVLFCVFMLLSLISFSFVSQVFAAADFNLVVDDDFTRANTTVGSGSNSTTGIGNGWVDFYGNIYKITSNEVVIQGSGGGDYPGTNGFYYNSGGSASFKDGKIRVTGTYSNGSSRPGAIARFNPASGGSGYGVFLFDSKIYFTKIVNGVETNLGGNDNSTELIPGVGAFPQNVIFEMMVNDIGTGTQITVNMYDQSAPNTLLGSVNKFDYSSPIQSAGYWGGSRFGSGRITRIELFVLDADSDIGAGHIQSKFSTTTVAFKTSAHLSSLSPIGGVPPYTYQWQRSLVSGSGFSNITGATTLLLSDTGLDPDTQYFYRMNITDSSVSPKTTTSDVIPVATFSDEAHVIGFIGDSITAGSAGGDGADPENSAGARKEFELLTAAGYEIGFINRGIGGTMAYHWLPSQDSTYHIFSEALAAFQAANVDTVSIMIGTNEARVFTQTPTDPRLTVQGYADNMTELIEGLLAEGTGITRIILNYPPYLNEGSAAQIASSTIQLLAFQPILNELASSIPGVYLGDTKLYAYTQSNLSIIPDGVHLNQAGNDFMGSLWAKGYVANFEKPSNIETTPAQTSAIITWDTNAPASSRVSYNITPVYAATSTNSSLVTSHSSTLSDLLPCVKYHFALSGSDAGGFSATSSDQSFITTGCTGSAAVASSTLATITTSAGGSLIFGESTLTVPIAYSGTTTSAVFQAKELDPDDFYDEAGVPSGKVRTGDYVVNFQAFINATNTLPTFGQPVTVTMSYALDDISNVQESSLEIFRYDGNSWTPLGGCVIDTGDQDVTCETTSFSDFGIFGDAVVASENPPSSNSRKSGSTVQNRVANLVAAGNQQAAQNLVNQYPAVFQKQTSIQASTPVVKALFTRSLTGGNTGLDVKELQKYLNSLGYVVAATGPGSPGNETEMFGALTRQALIRFQKENDIYPPLGFFGPITRAFILNR